LKPLKFRNDEILDLFSHYLRLFSHKLLNKEVSIDDNCKDKIMNYDWPGNVFQLMNISENIIKNIDISESVINLSHIDQHINNNNNNANNLYDLSYKDARNSFERDYLINKLKINNWNVTKTALSLNLDRVSLYRKIKTLKINLTE